jgi:hypothetical protein
LSDEAYDPWNDEVVHYKDELESAYDTIIAILISRGSMPLNGSDLILTHPSAATDLPAEWCKAMRAYLDAVNNPSLCSIREAMCAIYHYALINGDQSETSFWENEWNLFKKHHPLQFLGSIKGMHDEASWSAMVCTSKT